LGGEASGKKHGLNALEVNNPLWKTKMLQRTKPSRLAKSPGQVNQLSTEQADKDAEKMQHHDC
jgi:hypothetical protein